MDAANAVHDGSSDRDRHPQGRVFGHFTGHQHGHRQQTAGPRPDWRRRRVTPDDLFRAGTDEVRRNKWSAVSMSAVVNKIRRTFYMDSVALMRISRAVSSLAGIETAALMIGSTTNKKLMSDAGLLNSDSDSAGANDLIVAVRADNEG